MSVFGRSAARKRPKQLISLFGKGSFLQQTVNRVSPIVPLKNIYIITNTVQAPEVRKQLPKLPKQNVIAEPCGRDTCAAVTLGAAIVGARSITAVMAVLPADHVIPDGKKFQQVLADSFDLANRGRAIVTIGIKPTSNRPPVTVTSMSARRCHRRQGSNRTRPLFPRRAVRGEAELRPRAGIWRQRPLPGVERGNVHLVVC